MILLALCAVCLAAENSTQKAATTKAAASTTKKPEGTTKKAESKLPSSEGRGAPRMEVSDAQLEMALKDKRYLQRQLKCTLGEAPCDPVGRRLRSKF